MVPIQIGGKMEFFKSFKLLSGQRVVGFFFFLSFPFPCALWNILGLKSLTHRAFLISDKLHEPACCNPAGVLYAFKVFFSITDVTGNCFERSVWRLCLLLSHNFLSCYHWKSGDIFPKNLGSRDADDREFVSFYIHLSYTFPTRPCTPRT